MPVIVKLMQQLQQLQLNKKHRRFLQLQKQNAAVITMWMTLRSNVAISTAVMDLMVENYFFVELAARNQVEVAGSVACAFWQRLMTKTMRKWR